MTTTTRCTDHALGDVRATAEVHTNGIENFWAICSSARLQGHLHSAWPPLHLCAVSWTSACSRSTIRDLSDLQRFNLAVRDARGRRLTYNELTGKA